MILTAQIRPYFTRNAKIADSIGLYSFDTEERRSMTTARYAVS